MTPHLPSEEFPEPQFSYLMGTNILPSSPGWSCGSNERTSITRALSHLILVAALGGRNHFHPCSTGKETEAQRDRVVSLMSHSWLGGKQGGKPRHSSSRAHAHSHSKLESTIYRGQCSDPQMSTVNPRITHPH